MGLDAHLIKYPVPPEQLPLLREYLKEWQTARQIACHNKPAYQATAEEQERYLQFLKAPTTEKLKGLNLGRAQDIEYPSARNRFGNLGYWRVGYGVSSNPEENFLLEVVYKALPETHPNFAAYFPVDWAYAHQVMVEHLEQVKTNKQDTYIRDIEAFVETIEYVLAQADPETYFMSWFP